MSNLDSVKNIVVLMMENRSFDNFAGWLYQDTKTVSPNGDLFDGLTSSMYNPSPVNGQNVFVGSTTIHKNPILDPGEGFADTSAQLFGGNPPPGMQGMGYLTNFADNVKGKLDPNVIMNGFDPSIVSCTQRIAQQFAICDEWFCSIPTETWPNRSFVHAATSNGNIDNAPYDPGMWDVPTIFNVMSRRPGSSWRVYYDDFVIPLTWLQMRQLHPFGYWKNFHGLDDFYADAANGSLPQYSFIEPSFFSTPFTGPETDAHPPHNVFIGDQFIGKIYNAIIASPQFQANELLLIITFDEHGGCYDHVAPFANATPTPQTNPNFDFTRFGVRVPTIVVSPYVAAGSVFNKRPAGAVPAPGSTAAPWSTYTPYDHTSILRTIELCFGYDALSTRDAAAPDLGDILTVAVARTDYEPVPIATPPAMQSEIDADAAAPSPPLNDLQVSILVGLAHLVAPDVLHALDAAPALKQPSQDELAQLPGTVAEAVDYIRAKKQELGLT